MSEEFSKVYYWKEMLEPHLTSLGLRFEEVILVSMLEPYKTYMGFIRVSHLITEECPSMWFTNFIKIYVKFGNRLELDMNPVHFRKEIADWTYGTILTDNRKTD